MSLTNYLEAVVKPFLGDLPHKLLIGRNRMQPVEEVVLSRMLLHRLGVVHAALSWTEWWTVDVEDVRSGGSTKIWIEFQARDATRIC